jgi:hypothetical protein
MPALPSTSTAEPTVASTRAKRRRTRTATTTPTNASTSRTAPAGHQVVTGMSVISSMAA